mgnify:FL=1
MVGLVPGPVPKRSDQRVRRNKVVTPIDRVPARGRVVKPVLGFEAHPLVERLWDSLQESAQTRFYEPSDWAWASVVLHDLDRYLRRPQPSGQMFTALESAMSRLLVTEGARRQLRVEVDRQEVVEGPDVAALLKERLEA